MKSKSICIPLISREQINGVVVHLAAELNRDYRDKNPVVIGILKGCFIFLADLTRLLEFPVEIDFVRLSSYGQGIETSGKVKIITRPRTDVSGRDVIIVEDIIDSGLSINHFLKYIKKKQPASVKICVLADKSVRRRVFLDIDYLGFTVPDRFLVGYGLDCDEKYRNLPDICALEEQSGECLQ
jgi:hypoxanthine phosphoribosyltransferase